jgi:hypothetical protein
MALAAKQAGGHVEADPSGAGYVDLGPGVQIGKVVIRPHRPLDRVDIGLELDQIARHEPCSEAEAPHDLHEQPS